MTLRITTTTSNRYFVERRVFNLFGWEYWVLHKTRPFTTFEDARDAIERERRQRLTSVVDKFNEKTEIMRFDL